MNPPPLLWTALIIPLLCGGCLSESAAWDVGILTAPLWVPPALVIGPVIVAVDRARSSGHATSENQGPSVSSTVEGTNRGTVRGRVVWNEQPVPGAIVSVHSWTNYSTPKYEPTTTDADGRFSIPDVLEGVTDLHVRGNRPGFWLDDLTRFNMKAPATDVPETCLCKSFNLVSPRDREIISTTRPILKWNPYPDAVGYVARVYFIGPYDVNSGVVVLVFARDYQDQPILGTSVEVSTDLPPGEYRWRVDAFNRLGHIIGCDLRSFVVQAQPGP